MIWENKKSFSSNERRNWAIIEYHKKTEINFINYRMDNKKYVSLIDNQSNKYADCRTELYFSTK